MNSESDWFTSVDDEIMSWLEAHDVVFTPRSLFLSLKRAEPEDALPSYSQISRRTRFLANEAGLLRRYGETSRGYYCLSSLGQRWIDDDLSDEDLEQLAEVERAG